MKACPEAGAIARTQVNEDPDRAEMKIEIAHAGVLVFLDSYYPGWKGTVNSWPERLYRANYPFRGVLVEPEDHEVRFDYSPWSFRAGLQVGGGTIIVLGAAVGLS